MTEAWNNGHPGPLPAEIPQDLSTSMTGELVHRTLSPTRTPGATLSMNVARWGMIIGKCTCWLPRTKVQDGFEICAPEQTFQKDISHQSTLPWVNCPNRQVCNSWVVFLAQVPYSISAGCQGWTPGCGLSAICADTNVFLILGVSLHIWTEVAS